jgi:VIT1/CCC1 family predicted Fe2+/Mn2+ transporter
MVETMRRAAPRTPANITADPTREALEELKASLRGLLATLLERAFGIALDKVESLATSLDDIAARGGMPLQAILGGVRAKLQGRNPVWGAIRGVFGGMSPQVKALVILALVLALVLLPVTVVLVLLALIVLAVWAAVRSSSR